jgi:parallel beta-helix repeat protein
MTKPTKVLLSTPSKSLPRYRGIFWLLSFELILSLIFGLISPVSAETLPTSVLKNTYITYLPITQHAGTSYYVSTQGNDANPGTFERPWRTLSKAARMVQPADTVYVRGGVYKEAVDFSASGTSREPINITAYKNEIPIIDGNNYHIPADYGGALLELSGDFITVSGIEVRYSSYLGVLVSGAHSVADKINAHHNLHGGMRASGDDSIIQNSMVWSNDMQNYGGINPKGDSTGLTASRHPNNVTLSNNVVFGNWGIGLSTYESNGTTLEGNIVYDNFGPNVYLSDATNVLFELNFIYTTGAMIASDQIGIQMGDEVSNPPSSDITVINNIVYNTDRNLACWKGSTGKMTNVLIANNTFVNSRTESGVIFNDGLLFENVRFFNNLVMQEGDLPVISVSNSHPGLTFSNNLWSKPPRAAASGPGDIIGDPLLARTGDPYQAPWFRLTGYSPARDQALTLPQVFVDYFGVQREAPPDIGASEFFPNP